jgi:hypothetical protein
VGDCLVPETGEILDGKAGVGNVGADNIHGTGAESPGHDDEREARLASSSIAAPRKGGTKQVEDRAAGR